MSTTQNKEDDDIKSLYGRACTLPKDDFIKQYGINENGLTTEQAQERLKEYGLNQISGTKPKKWYNYLLESLFTPFNSILLRYCSNFILH